MSKSMHPTTLLPQMNSTENQTNLLSSNDIQPNNSLVNHSLPQHPSRNEMRPYWKKNNNNINNRTNNNKNHFQQDYQHQHPIGHHFNNNKRNQRYHQQETLFVANLPPVLNDEELEELKKELLAYLEQFCTIEKLQMRHGKPSITDPQSNVRLPIAFALLSFGETVANVIRGASRAPFRQSYSLRLETAWNQRQIRVKFTNQSLNLEFFRQSVPWSQEPQKYYLLFNHNRTNVTWKLIREICSVFGNVKMVFARQPLHQSAHTCLYDVDFEHTEDCLLAFHTLASFQHKSGLRVQMRGHFFDEHRLNDRLHSRSVHPSSLPQSERSPTSLTPSMALTDLQSDSGQDIVSNSQSPTTPKNEIAQFTNLNAPQTGRNHVTPVKPRLTLQTLLNSEVEQNQSNHSHQNPMIVWNNPMMNRANMAIPSHPNAQPLVNMNAIPIMPGQMIHPSQGIYMGNVIQNINGTFHQVPMMHGMPMHFFPYQIPMHLPSSTSSLNQPNQQTQSPEGPTHQQERLQSDMNVPLPTSPHSGIPHQQMVFHPLSNGQMRTDQPLPTGGMVTTEFNDLPMQEPVPMENEGQIHIPAWQSGDSYY